MALRFGSGRRHGFGCAYGSLSPRTYSPILRADQRMSPAVLPGVHVLMEGVSFLARKPRRGDVAPTSATGMDGPLIAANVLFCEVATLRDDKWISLRIF
jgi:hypothetical protein